MNIVAITLSMGLAWLAVTGSWTAPNLILGLVLARIALFLVRGEISRKAITLRPLKFLRLAALFAYELVLSASRVAVLVLSPRMALRPGILAVPLTVDRDFEIALLANLITLTPGTLSVDVSADRRTLFVHAIDASGPDRTRSDIAIGFERLILETFR